MVSILYLGLFRIWSLHAALSVVVDDDDGVECGCENDTSFRGGGDGRLVEEVKDDDGDDDDDDVIGVSAASRRVVDIGPGINHRVWVSSITSCIIVDVGIDGAVTATTSSCSVLGCTAANHVAITALDDDNDPRGNIVVAMLPSSSL